MIAPDLLILCRRLRHEFSDPRLLAEALTHRSASGRNNERLEFLGDGVLNFVIAEQLYSRHPRASEGELSRLRASLVKQETLAAIARELELGEHLRLGQGELKSGGFRRDSILADALEAIFGAIYLDAGFSAAQTVIVRLFEPLLREQPRAEQLKDPKTRLQEWLQAQQRPLPLYQVLEVSGEAHRQCFTVECRVDNVRTVASAPSRRRAEQEAAKLALERLQ
ncbi:MAG TPA: ribonuclease III [Candidatus Competibacteraceae bacterium]|nr:ribonuclease III [Candidatus Competibacteraceae bacterium]